MNAHMQRLTCLGIALSIAAGCARNADAPAAREESVKPGINESYENPDVTQWVERFEREGREIYRERQRIVDAVGLRPGQRIADVGAGTGLFEELFSKAVGADGRVYAVDIVPAFLEHIRERSAASGLDNVETVLCKEDSVELPAGSIDVAFICDTYHHFEYPRSTMRSVHDALRPGGLLVVIDFARIEGTSSDWVLNHVRAGQDDVTSEITSYGFELIDDGAGVDFLKDNFLIRFRRSDR